MSALVTFSHDIRKCDKSNSQEALFAPKQGPLSRGTTRSQIRHECLQENSVTTEP